MQSVTMRLRCFVDLSSCLVDLSEVYSSNVIPPAQHTTTRLSLPRKNLPWVKGFRDATVYTVGVPGLDRVAYEYCVFAPLLAMRNGGSHNPVASLKTSAVTWPILVLRQGGLCSITEITST